MRSAIVVAILAVFLCPTSGAAEERRLGLVAGWPGSIGAIWHVMPQVAVRADASLSSDSTETVGSGPAAATTATEVSEREVGVAAIVFLRAPSSQLRPYVSARLGHERTSVDATIAVSSFSQHSVTNAVAPSGALGAHYALSSRFAVFGEVGASYTARDGTSTVAASRTRSSGHTWSSHSGFGAVFYF